MAQGARGVVAQGIPQKHRPHRPTVHGQPGHRGAVENRTVVHSPGPGRAGAGHVEAADGKPVPVHDARSTAAGLLCDIGRDGQHQLPLVRAVDDRLGQNMG